MASVRLFLHLGHKKTGKRKKWGTKVAKGVENLLVECGPASSAAMVSLAAVSNSVSWMQAQAIPQVYEACQVALVQRALDQGLKTLPRIV